MRKFNMKKISPFVVGLLLGAIVALRLITLPQQDRDRAEIKQLRDSVNYYKELMNYD